MVLGSISCKTSVTTQLYQQCSISILFCRVLPLHPQRHQKQRHQYQEESKSETIGAQGDVLRLKDEENEEGEEDDVLFVLQYLRSKTVEIRSANVGPSNAYGRKRKEMRSANIGYRRKQSRNGFSNTMVLPMRIDENNQKDGRLLTSLSMRLDENNREGQDFWTCTSARDRKRALYTGKT